MIILNVPYKYDCTLVGLAQPFGPGKLDEMGWSLVENYVSFKSVIENGQWTNAKVVHI